MFLHGCYGQRRSRVDSLAEDGFGDVPLTSVFGGYILSGSPFVDTPGAMVQTFFEDAVKKFGRLDARVTGGTMSYNCLESYWRNWEKTQTTKPYELRLRSHFLAKLSTHLNPRWTLGIRHQCLSIFWSKQFFGCRDDRSMQHQSSVWLVLHKEVQFAKDSCFDAEKHGEAWLKSRVPTAGKKMPVYISACKQFQGDSRPDMHVGPWGSLLEARPAPFG